jgi:hypothetical protein
MKKQTTTAESIALEMFERNSAPFAETSDKIKTMAEEVAKNTIKNGGDTVLTVDGSRPDSGYCVGGAMPGEVVENFKNETDLAERITMFMVTHEGDLLHGKGYALGTWIDPETGWVDLDVSNVVADYRTAMKLAKQRGEVAIYRVRDGRTIYVNKDRALV